MAYHNLYFLGVLMDTSHPVRADFRNEKDLSIDSPNNNVYFS